MKKTKASTDKKVAASKKTKPERSPAKGAAASGKAKKASASKPDAALSTKLEKLQKQVENLKTSGDEQKKKLQDLALYSEAMQATGQAILITDKKWKMLGANPAFLDMFKYTAEELTGKKATTLWAESNEPKHLDELKEAVRKKGTWQGELIGLTKDNALKPVWLQVSTMKAPGNRASVYAVSAFDVSPVKENEQRLEHMAYYDGLTSLPNRTLLTDRLKHALIMAQRHGYPVAVIYLDLDRFKEINDTLGHNVGDLLLVEAAKRLKEQVRESDTVSRIGGDEFLILLPEVGSAQNAANISQKILDTMVEPFLLADHELFISASVGISLYPSDSEDADMLVMNADTAMYHAKAQGKNNYKFFTEDINKSTVQRFMLETRFRRALDKLEFQLNYQPKVNMTTGKISGMEALLRWYHPDQGSVKPSLFIPLAEETGLVLPLGEWALKEACRQNKEWQDEGLRPIRVSVNLSARQFRKSDLLDMVKSTLHETGLAPEHLMLEITETAIIDDIDSTIILLKDFRKLGVGVSVDDFGTGYSSLNYLNRFSIDELKIDQSFIAAINDADNRKVVNAIIALAHSLKHKVVAEGVEEKDQLDFLRENDCDEVQGYYFSMPLSGEEFHRLLSDDRPFFF